MITDEEKALEITIKLEGEIGTSPHSREAIQDSILEMAQWKQQQMIEKAINWLSKRVFSYDGCFIEDFKRAMGKE